MNKIHETAHKHMPEKVRRLMEAAKKADRLNNRLINMEEEIAYDIIDGWTTGDKILDFALVACNGAFDKHADYQELSELALKKPGQRIMVVQKAEHVEDDEFIIIRNIYLAVLRRDEVEFNIEKINLGLPVESGYFLWREFIQDDLIMTGHKVVHKKWLHTGALRNMYNNIGYTHNDPLGLQSVPLNSVCDIELLPSEDLPKLNREHGVDAELLNKMHRMWIRAKSST